jgi:predicted RND superfamily exporter protein/outer membrane lipoprotein-sorting protein
MLERYLRTVVRHRFVVMLLVALTTLLLASQTRELSIVVDPDDILPQSHPLISTTNRIEALFGNRFTVVIGVHANNGTVYEAGVAERVRAITDDVLKLPGVVRANVNSIAARKAKSITGNDEGMVVKPLLGSGPQAAEALQSALTLNPVYTDLLVSRDGRTAQVVAEFKKIPGGFAAIESQVREVVKRHADPSVQIDVGGTPVFLALLEKFSQRMSFLFPLAVLIIGLIHYEAFRTVQALVLPLVTALLAVVWALGMLGLARQPFDTFNAATPILILAIAAGHAVQILKRFYEEYAALEASEPEMSPRERSKAAVVRSLTRVGPVMVAAGGVAIAGFASLVVFEIKSIQVFGLFTAAGIASALVLELTLIPALRASLPAPGRRELDRERMPTLWSRLTERAFQLSTTRPRAVFAVAAAVAVAAVAGASQVRVDNSQKGYFYGSVPAKVEDARLNERMGGTNSLYVLVKGREDDALKQPAVLKAMQALQEKLAADPMVGKTLSLADFVRRMHRAMNGDDPSFDAIPDSADLIAQYLFLYSTSGDPSDFDSYVDTNYRNGLITVFVRTDGTAYSQDLIGRVREIARTGFGPEVEIAVGGGTAATVALTETIVKEKVLNILQIMAAVLLITSLVFRSLAAGLVILMPVLAAVLVNFGLMGIAGIPLQIGTALVSAMAVGIGADYGIYMIYRMREELGRGGDVDEALHRAFRSAGKAVLFVSTAVAGGFGLLMLSWGFWVHFYLGFLVAVAMLVSSVTALTLLPAVVFRFKPRFVFGTAATRPVPVAPKAAALMLALAVGAAAWPGGEARAQTPTAEEIATRNFAVGKVADSVTEATFRLISPNGQERVRKTQGRSKLKAGSLDNRSLVRFLSPADVRGTVSLTIENSEPGRDDDIWIYLPALKKVRRLVSSNKKDSFVGTDFSYGDVIGYRVADWTHRVLREEKVDGFDCWVMESLPKNAQVREDSGYTKRMGWIRKDNFAAVRAESYDLSGALLKVILLRDHRNVDPKNGKWVAMKLEAQNVQENRRTVIEFDRYEVNQGVSEDSFTARALERES